MTSELRALADRATPTLCVECGPNVRIDEDGCCVTCGGSATGTWLYAVQSAVPARLDRVAELEAGLREAVNLASTSGVYCDPFTSGCDNPECNRLDALSALVTK